ncbi:MAG TPA: response regulator [Myxococcales bacterium]|jgi:CheY-like chemotaxis protein|nr:response regulator [Myxococcales bacterium]
MATAKSILLVDDEFSIVDALAEMLRWEGYSVLTARNGQRGLDELERGEISLVLLDYMMPVMDGLTTLERIRAEPAWQAIPVVLMTAASLPAGASGWDALLRKPFEAGALFSLVHRLAGPPADGASGPRS